MIYAVGYLRYEDEDDKIYRVRQLRCKAFEKGIAVNGLFLDERLKPPAFSDCGKRVQRYTRDGITSLLMEGRDTTWRIVVATRKDIEENELFDDIRLRLIRQRKSIVFI